MAEAEKVLLAHPLGSPFATNAALGLAEAGCRVEIASCFSFGPEGAVCRVVGAGPLARELERRSWIPSGIPVRHYGMSREILRVALERSGARRLLGLRSSRLTDWVYTSFDRSVAAALPLDTSAIYSYEDGALETFRRARRLGAVCLYDLPIMFHRASATLFAEERERYPELRSGMPLEPDWKIERKDQEVQLADHIVVASHVTKSSLLEHGIPAGKISVIPYGTESVEGPAGAPDRFRALFVGRVGPRKGVHYLLDAWRVPEFTNAELLLVGVNEFPEGWLEAHLGRALYQPSLPRSELRKIYASSSVLVLPSLVEGFGMVILEAMSCGVPVITTPNTAGPEIIESGVDGFIVPIRDVDALREKLAWCAGHPAELREMGRRARDKARLYSWNRYRAALGETIRSLLHT